MPERAWTLPPSVLAMADRGPDWAAWVERLPATIEDLLEEWELEPIDWVMHGFSAVVFPVRTRRGEVAMLKVAFPAPESEHEHLALTHWHGHGAVRLLRADPHRRALLLEALGNGSLREAWDVEACRIVGELYGRLHVPAFRPLRTLSEQVARTADELAALPRSAPFPRRLVEQAASLARSFAADGATDGTVVHGDLHYANVLPGEREPWLVIDPKPLSGDPHYEIAPMLWNRFDELAGDVRNGVRQRFHTLIDTAGLDEDRARDWVVVRMVTNALWELTEYGGFTRKVLDDDWLTRCIAVAKAVQE